MLHARKPYRRSALRRNFLGFEVLEGREVPATLYVSPSFTLSATDLDSGTPGVQVDGDLVTPLDQIATVGTDAFDTIPAATAAVTATTDIVLVNEGDYTANGAITMATGYTLRFQGASATVASLATADAAASLVLDTTLTLGDGTDKTFAGVVSGAGGLVKIGTGTLTLTNANLYSGTTTVNAGVLAVTNAAGLGATTGRTNVNGPGIVDFSGAGPFAEPATLTTTANGIGTLRHSGTTATTWSGGLILAGGGGRLDNFGTGLYTQSAGISGTAQALSLGGTGNVTVSGLISTGVGGTIIKDGIGVGTLGNANNSFAAVDATSIVIQVLGGVLSQNGEGASLAGSVSTTGLIPAVTVPSYVLLNGGTLRSTRVGIGAAFLATPKGITLGASGGSLEVIDATAGNLNVYAGIVSGTLGGTLTRVGPTGSILSMSGASTYNGATIVSGGIFRVRTSPNRFPITTALIVNAPGVFDLNSVGQQVGSLAGNGNITLGGTSLTVGDAASNTMYSGVISGTGRFTKVTNNASTLTLAGASTYNNVSNFVTLVGANGGTLLLGNSTGSALGTNITAVQVVNIGATIGSVSTSNAGSTVTPLNILGTVAPGNVGATGRLTTGVITIGTSGIFDVDIKGTTAGFGPTGYDQLAVIGTVTIVSGAKLVFNNTGVTSAINDSFTIIDNDGTEAIVGIFKDEAGNDLIQNSFFTTLDGQLFRISYTGGAGNNDVVVTRVLPFETYYVSPLFTANGTTVDGDAVMAGSQDAEVGTRAFSTIAAAVAATLNSTDKIIINAGSTSFDFNEAVNLGTKALQLTFQEGDITVKSLAGTNTASITVFGTTAGGARITVMAGSDNLPTTFASSISGPGGFIKVGSGALTLNPLINNYSGPTTLADGQIIAGSIQATSALSPLAVSTGARLVLNGFNNQVGNLSGTGIVENASAVANAVLTAGSTKIADDSSFDLVFTGTLQDGVGGKSLGFRKVGPGELLIPSNYAYTGPFFLNGGLYIVDSLPVSLVPGPFGASTSDAANFSFSGGTIRYTGATPPAPFDRNLTWGSLSGTIEVADPAAVVTFTGIIAGSGTGAFVKAGDGKLVFTAPDAFGTAHTLTSVGTLSTGNVTVTGGNLSVANIRTTTGTRAGGNRRIALSAGTSLTATGTISVDPSNSYIDHIAGPGTLNLRNAAASKTNPTIAFDWAPGGGDGIPFGLFITAPVDFGSVNAVIVGKADRNDVGRYSGDLRFNGAWTGTGNVQFIGLSSANSSNPPTNTAPAHNVHYVLNNTSPDFKGDVSLANADLILTKPDALSAENGFTFNSVVDPLTQNRAALFLYGYSVNIGALNDTSAAGTTSFIRNGARVASFGGSNTAGASGSSSLGNPGPSGTGSDSVLTITQDVNGSFAGRFDNGLNDNGEGLAGSYHNLSIIKNGAKTLTLSGASTLTGSVNIASGTLIQNGSFATTLGITVDADADLAGSGTLKAATVTGRISAGTVGTPGMLTVPVDLTINTGGALLVDITGAAAGTGYDQIIAGTKGTGTINTSGATLTLAGTFNPTTTDALKIIDNLGAGTIPEFANAAQGSTLTLGSTNYVVSYVGGDGNDLTLTPQLSVTPTVTGFTVNPGQGGQRSRVTTITVAFAAAVNPADFNGLGDITLTNTTTGAVVRTGVTGPGVFGLINVAGGPNANELVLTFANTTAADLSNGVEFGSLADGVYTLTIAEANNYDSVVAGGPAIVRLFGDINGDRTVEGGADFSAFGATFGLSNGDPGFLTAFDFNQDGTVEGGVDFSQFGTRFGLSL